MEEKELRMHIQDGKIGHDIMARHLMDNYIFKTFKDTEQILIFSRKRGYYTSDSSTTIKKVIHKTLTNLGLAKQSKKGFINEVTAYIQRSTYVSRGKFNAKEHFLNINNGILKIRTGTVIPHNPKLLSTMCIPVSFDETTRCPVIDKFFRQIVAENDVPLLIEIVAWCLDLNSRIQRFVLFIGEGANGKSTFVNLLRAFIGEKNCSSVTLQSLSHNRFASAELFGKFVNIYPDLPSASIKDTGRLKALTGGDAIPAERKFEHQFTFVNKAKLIFSANKPPTIDDDSYAIWRRAIIIDFPNTFAGSNRDPDLIDKLTTPEELSGLLNLAIDKLKILREQGDFSCVPTWEGTRSKYALISDPVVEFVETKCVLDPVEEIPKPRLFTAYSKFCIQSGIPVGTNRGFGRILKNKYSRTIRERQNNWTGITLKKRKK
ncbi:phage/plasmid primase, P4 family [Chloroflexota bacterium]